MFKTFKPNIQLCNHILVISYVEDINQLVILDWQRGGYDVNNILSLEANICLIMIN